MASSAEIVNTWHDFYILVGTASATLVGLLFVAASVGSGMYTKDTHSAMRAFVSPSVVHFTSVMAACLIAIAPIRSWTVLGVLIAGEGLFGIVYAGLVWHNMMRHGYIAKIDLEDRVWYAALPAIGYAVMTSAGAAVLLQRDIGAGLLALAMGLLLLVGIRNAWDITVFAIIRRRE
jgi:hypothetical protein